MANLEVHHGRYSIAVVLIRWGRHFAMMQQVRVRAFLPTDLGDIEALSRSVFEGDVVGDRLITRDLVLAPDFDPDNLVVAEVAGRFAGFGLLAASDSAPQDLWLVAFGVVPEFRGGGVGKELVAAMVERAVVLGAARLGVGAVPTRYLVPGVDRRTHGPAYDLLTKHFGFLEIGTAHSMSREIGDADVAPLPEGVSVLLDEEVAELRAFVLTAFDAVWWEYLATSLRAKFLDGAAHRAGFVAKVADEIIGVVHVHNNRFGPLAVGASSRGCGYGRLLSQAALSAARRFGYADVYFMKTEPAVVPFYQRLGFTERCTYTELSKTL